MNNEKTMLAIFGTLGILLSTSVIVAIWVFSESPVMHKIFGTLFWNFGIILSMKILNLIKYH